MIHKFINTPSKPQIALPGPALSEDLSISDIWAQEEMDTLYWYYVQSKKTKDTVSNILNQIKEAGHKMKSRIAVIQQLLQQEFISPVEFDDLMKYEDSQYEQEVKIASSSDSATKEESGVDVSDSSVVATVSQSDDITVSPTESRVGTTKVIKTFPTSFCAIAYLRRTKENSSCGCSRCSSSAALSSSA